MLTMRPDMAMTPSSTVAYDANGNILSDPSGNPNTWDFENRLTQAVVPGANGGTTTFKYDPFGRRIQKSGPLGMTNYLYDGINLLGEVDSAGNVLDRYVQGPNVDEPVAELRSASTSYYEPDGLGSITSQSSPSGTIQSTYVYDSFGNSSSSTGSTNNPFRYTSREFDSETGRYDYRLRYYQRSAGRFLSEDPWFGAEQFRRRHQKQPGRAHRSVWTEGADSTGNAEHYQCCPGLGELQRTVRVRWKIEERRRLLRLCLVDLRSSRITIRLHDSASGLPKNSSIRACIPGEPATGRRWLVPQPYRHLRSECRATTQRVVSVAHWRARIWPRK